MTSSRTRSYESVSSAFMPSLPFSATAVLCPSACKSAHNMSRFISVSSTTNTFAGEFMTVNCPQNPKSEARNPKQTGGQINPKLKKIQNPIPDLLVWNIASILPFIVLKLFRISIFGFRAFAFLLLRFALAEDGSKDAGQLCCFPNQIIPLLLYCRVITRID